MRIWKRNRRRRPHQTRSFRKVNSASYWVSCVARILKEADKGGKGYVYAGVDGAFDFAGSLDAIERTQALFGSMLGDLSHRLENTAEPFSRVTVAWLSTS